MSVCDQGHRGAPGRQFCGTCGHQLYDACANGHWVAVGAVQCRTCGAPTVLIEPPAEPTAPAAAPSSPTPGAASGSRRWDLIIGSIVVVVLLLVVAGVVIDVTRSKGGSKHPAAAPATTSVPTTTGSSGGSSSTAPSGPLAGETGLASRSAPAVSTQCTVTPGATPAPGAAASGNAVAVLPAPTPVPFPALDGTSPHYTRFAAAPPYCIDASRTYVATMKTDVGTIVIDLFPSVAPLTVDNFVFLAGYHFYDGTVFHRVIKGFVDQGGDPTGTGSGGPGYAFDDELPSSASAYQAGTLAMANSGANTNGSQFFVVVGSGGSQLTPDYSVFGKVVSGLSVVNDINADGASSDDSAGTPAQLHRIISVTIAVH